MSLSDQTGSNSPLGKAAVLRAHLLPRVPLVCQMENAVHLRNQGQGSDRGTACSITTSKSSGQVSLYDCDPYKCQFLVGSEGSNAKSRDLSIAIISVIKALSSRF